MLLSPVSTRVARQAGMAQAARATNPGYWTADWAEIVDIHDPDAASSLPRCTYSGRPFGSQAFVDEMSRRFGRYWTRGRPPKRRSVAAGTRADQYSLFAE